jgi:hypothetical protein
VSNLYNLTDSETRLPTLKWKTDKSKTKFCFVESFSLQCDLFTGRKYESSFSNPLPVVLISLAVPTEQRQVYALRYHKSTHECLKLNGRTWTALLSHGANTREVSYLEFLTEHLKGRAGRTKLTNLVKESHPQGYQPHLNLRPPVTAATASNTELPGAAVLSSCAAWGRTDVMISSCRCCGRPGFLRVPTSSSCGWVLNRLSCSLNCFCS